MFDGKYFEWNQKRAKGIVDFYGYKFFYFKKVLDLGCGYGDLGGVIYRLGASVTGVDARQEHLKIVNKKFTGIKTVQANLDINWPFYGQKFDVILDLALMCHLADYEAHLKAVCTSTTHLILETAVCDSDDPQKCILIDEDKGTYDLSYSGKGCRPSPAAIERILREHGMNFKRMDNAKFNAADYVYDWYPKNDNSTSLNKRRIWFAVREESPIQFANPNSEIASVPITVSPQGYIPTGPGSSTIITSASPKLPMSARIEAETKARAAYTNNGGVLQKILSTDDKVKYDSREFSIIEIDGFSVPTVSKISGVIATNSYSSRMWYKKIAPLFPNLKLAKNVLTMPGFSKSDNEPNIIMCSLNNLQSCKRIWIDEWFGPSLTNEHINILKNCSVIITPSLVNAQEIWKSIPHANIFRIGKPWPLINVPPAEGNYYLYFEKNPILTSLLFESWNAQNGNLVVVGSGIKIPSFATFISDTESYTQIMKLIKGAKAIIDLSENNYYNSGINKLAVAIGTPIITNNCIRFGSDITIIQQDKQISYYPTIDYIKQAINKFINSSHSKSTSPDAYNFSVEEDVRKILGV